MTNMDKQTIEQQGIADKYIRGELDESQIEAFEDYLMEHPELVERLEIDSLLYRSMPAAIKISQEKTQSSIAKAGFWSWLQKPWAVSFATMAFCAALYPFLDSMLSKQTDDVITNIPQIFLAPSRGDSATVPVVNATAKDRYFEITVQPENISVNRFNIEIANRDSGDIILPPRNVDIMPNGDIKLMLPTQSYPAGQYLLKATPIENDAKLEKFMFDLKIAP